MRLIILFFLTTVFTAPVKPQDQHYAIKPGKSWTDESGRPINAHGGGVLYFKKTYYWFGEIKKGKTTRAADITSWEDYRVDVGGISCYSSRDLVNWKFERVALAPVQYDTASDLYVGKVVERPKVLFNAKTHQFVMWMHIDRYDYGAARAGVAVSSSPTGPYRYLGSFRPNGQMSRDITAFKDDDGQGYIIYSSENNKTMQICRLTGDYLSPTKVYKRILVNENREAPAIFKQDHKYYLITSRCTGWDPNEAQYAIADSLMGDWTKKNNPCQGPGADSTFQGQGTFVIAVSGRENDYIFMADRWDKTDLQESKYLWLPLKVLDGRPSIVWKNNWTPN